jgi:tellurite resistance protein
MALAQLRLLPAYVRLPFLPGAWAFTFSWAAVATVAIHWLNDTTPGGYRIVEYLVLAAISGLIGGIAIPTLVAIGRRQLMPGPVPARIGAPAASGSAGASRPAGYAAGKRPRWPVVVRAAEPPRR